MLQTHPKRPARTDCRSSSVLFDSVVVLRGTSSISSLDKHSSFCSVSIPLWSWMNRSPGQQPLELPVYDTVSELTKPPFDRCSNEHRAWQETVLFGFPWLCDWLTSITFMARHHFLNDKAFELGVEKRALIDIALIRINLRLDIYLSNVWTLSPWLDFYA